MKFLVFSFILFLSLSFSQLGIDCRELEAMCAENACAQAGGHYSSGLCIQGGEFNAPYYENATAECAGVGAQCREAGGMMVPRNASCCGPVFIILTALGIAAGSRFK